jgi:tetratricopeptide (TPR) repeat protein/predicted Ser/Thr protein kinase
MANDLIPDGQSAEPAASGGLQTGFAPPYRALLGTPAAPGANPAVLPESGQATSGELPAVPGYEVLAELGRGGMGVVYQARQCSLKRLVALKMILAGLHADSTARGRFRTEAEAVARLQHPNIVQIYEVGEHEGRSFLSLEYVEGGSLLRQTGGRAQLEQEAARLVETLARAVHAMHQRGILHRDLKPSNVLLTADGTPKITDFGLAKLLDADCGLTRSETLLGTPNYMAPEQAAGDTRNVGVPADVYSLGAILYELLTGRAPFLGATALSTLLQVRNQEAVPPRRLRRSLSLDLETICLKCLEKEPSKRYASAEALADDLRCFLAGQPIHARPVPVWQRLWRAARRRPARMAGALAGVALVALVLTAWSYFRAADQLAPHRALAKYQQFVQRRNEALVYGLLAPDQGSLFLGAEAAANLKTAESAAREALALAGVEAQSGPEKPAPGFPASRQAEVAADCYTLLLVLASVRGQEFLAEKSGKERYEEALRILDHARQLGFQTRAYHLRRAHVLDLLGEQQEARKERNRAASQPPEGALDHFLLGEEQYRRGHWEQAMNSFNQALTLQPGHFWAQFFLAVCQLKVQRWEAARAGLNSCLAQQPHFAWAYLFRSFANEKLRAFQEAETDFEKVLQFNLNEDTRYVLFLARGIFHVQQGELERAAADFRSAMTLKPEQYNAYLDLAKVYLAQGQFEEAAQQARTARRFRPPALPVADYHFQRGQSLLRAKRYEEASQACEAALELSPHQPRPHEVRGRALLELGRYAQAERSFDQYLREGGVQETNIFRGRGLARMKLGKYPEAVEDYTRALELAPDADIYQQRGWAHFFADAWKLALRDFSKAIELDPAPADASGQKHLQALVAQTVTSLATTRLPSAMTQLFTLKQLQDAFALGDAYTGRGLSRVMLGDYRGGVADAEEALRRKPREPEMMHNIACIFAQALVRAEAGQQQSLADSYRRRALEAVHQTLALLRPEERSSFWREKILPDAGLTPIHNTVEFKRLQEEYNHR